MGYTSSQKSLLSTPQNGSSRTDRASARGNTLASTTEAWLEDLKCHVFSNQACDPNYWSSNPSTLITTSQPISFTLGTGYQVLKSALAKCEATKHELVIVTCFWAESSSRGLISSLLLKLSAKAVAQSRWIRVRLCFSSHSISQKLFQTSSLDGENYPPSTWPDLGLPAAEHLQGLDMVVKSIFVRPFSVMHPKFILMDRELAFLPSCNVSWEDWFEGCIEMRGGIVAKLFDFWAAFWTRGEGALPPFLPREDESSIEAVEENVVPSNTLINHTSFSPDLTPHTILLPSPHNINPHFRPFTSSPCPPTPLNLFLLQLFADAKRTIFIQTPNITSAPVISALLSALQGGINITLITSSQLMILEQLVTAGTITEFELWKLRRHYTKLLNQYATRTDPEALELEPGKLRIGYYHARNGEEEEEPVKSHLKLVLVDEEVVVLGSGNMDRASWYTSQELGVAMFSKEVADEVRRAVDEGLVGRVEYVC